MSASGQYQTAVINGNNGIYYSSNYGLSWTESVGEPTTGIEWFSVCCSASGQYQVAVMNTASLTGVWYSTNYGINWSSATTAMGLPSNSPRWTFCEISDNGQYCTAVAQTGQVFQTVIRAPTLYTSGGAIIAGNVGIGTTSPGAILHITNSAVATTYTNKVTMAVSDGIADPSTTYGMINLTRQSDVTDNKGHIAFIRNGNTVQSMGYLQGSNTFGWVANANMNTSSGIFMASTGNVGIGTTAPTTTLHVSGASSTYTNGQLFISDANYPGNQLRLFSYWGIQISTSFATIQSMYDTTPNRLAINPNGGNVGIGTTNPGYTLDVVGSSSISSPSYVAFRNTGGGLQTTGGDLVNTQISLGGGFGPYIRAVQPNNTYTDHIRLDLCTNLTNNNATPVPRISILSGLQGGNVGIGTTNPSSRLHVNGDIRIGTSAGTNLDASGTGFTINALGAGNAFINIQAGLSSGAIGFFNGVGGIQQRICYMASQLDLGPVYCSSAGGQLQSTNPSDITLKRNVHSMTDNLSILSKLRPVSFNWIDTLLYNSKINYGFIAQEIQEVIPDIVSSYIDTSGNSKYGFDTISIIPFLVGAIKEQHVIIQQQASTITSLESRLTSLEQRLINAGIA
jgi:hypothetical protein